MANHTAHDLHEVHAHPMALTQNVMDNHNIHDLHESLWYYNNNDVAEHIAHDLHEFDIHPVVLS
jgi:hypothetical protein